MRSFFRNHLQNFRDPRSQALHQPSCATAETMEKEFLSKGSSLVIVSSLQMVPIVQFGLYIATPNGMLATHNDITAVRPVIHAYAQVMAVGVFVGYLSNNGSYVVLVWIGYQVRWAAAAADGTSGLNDTV